MLGVKARWPRSRVLVHLPKLAVEASRSC